MHTEVHVHGTVLLKSGVSQTDIELALRHWFDYVDVDGLADARSAHQDEPGIVFDRRRSSGLRSVPAGFPEKSTCTRNRRPKVDPPSTGGFQLFHRNPLIS